MLKILCFHKAVDVNAGDYQRIRKLQYDVFSMGNSQFQECILTRIPTSLNSLLILGRLSCLIPSQRLCILPVLLPLSRFSVVRIINRNIMNIVGIIFGHLLSPDIVIGETTGTWNAVRSCARAHPQSISWLDFHGATPEEALLIHPGQPKIDRVVIDLRNQERDAFECADIITCQSEAMIVHLKNLYDKERQNVYAYHCGVDKNIFTTNDEYRIKNRTMLGFSNNDRVLVYAGGLHKWQMFSETLQMIAFLHKRDPRYKGLILTCDAHEDVLKIANKHFLRPEGYVVRSVPHQDVPAFLVVADVALLLREDNIVNKVACPTKLGEYLACGLPIITGEVADHWTWISQEKSICLKIDPNDTGKSYDLLVPFISKLRRDRTTIQERCRKVAIDMLSQEQDAKTVRQYIAPIIQKIFADRRTGRKNR